MTIGSFLLVFLYDKMTAENRQTVENKRKSENERKNRWRVYFVFLKSTREFIQKYSQGQAQRFAFFNFPTFCTSLKGQRFAVARAGCASISHRSSFVSFQFSIAVCCNWDFNSKVRSLVINVELRRLRDLQ